MKISPKKDYKKPLYAAAVTVVAAATAVGVTGCPVAEKEEDPTTTTTEELALAGVETVDPFYATESEVELDGDVVCPVEPTESEELILDGEVETVLPEK